MSRAIRFTAAELAAVEWAATEAGPIPHGRALARLAAKMKAASAPATPTAADFVAVRAATFCRIAEEVLGDLVFMPPHPTSQWWGRLQASLTAQGIDAEGARRALEYVATWARQPQDPQSLAQRASRYLHQATATPAKEPHDGEEDLGPVGRPPELR